jgi:hypothetical protein
MNVKQDQLSSQEATDGEVYNRGRSEGHADIAAKLRAIIDPEDQRHLNLTGLLKEVERLVKYKEEAHEVITYIREADALKSFAYENDDGPSIAELLRECYYRGEGYKNNLNLEDSIEEKIKS